jgi:hypothetical protein
MLGCKAGFAPVSREAGKHRPGLSAFVSQRNSENRVKGIAAARYAAWGFTSEKRTYRNEKRALIGLTIRQRTRVIDQWSPISPGPRNAPSKKL